MQQPTDAKEEEGKRAHPAELLKWDLPIQTRGGKLFWIAVRRNPFFELQRHKSATEQTKPVKSAFSGLRGVWSKSKLPYRIIILQKPYMQVASSMELETLLENWLWIEENLLYSDPPFTTTMKPEEVHPFLIYLFNLLANQQFHKVKELLAAQKQTTNSKQEELQQRRESRKEGSNEDGEEENDYQELKEEEEEEEKHKEETSNTKKKDADDDEEDEKDLCKICYDGEIETVILECGHAVLCHNCATTLNLFQCPICRTPISSIRRMYRS
ncbi:putative nuclear distribution protein nudc [Balamuthia mandrillaris]